MASLLDRIDGRIDTFIRDNDAFQSACDRCFIEADKDDDGKLNPTEVVNEVDAIFEDIDDVLRVARIHVEKPSRSKIETLLKAADVNRDDVLDEEEFFMFYRQVLKLAAFNSARGFIAKHGAALMAGVASALAIEKGKERFEIPEELKPLMPYATPVISFAVGILARYGITLKRTNEAEKKLFRCQSFKKPVHN